MNRREFLRLAGASVISGASVFSSGCSPLGERNVPSSTSASKTTAGAVSFPLRIARVKLEISPNQIIQTVGYNGSVPGPLLRVKEGQQVTVDVHNDSDVPELVHWHGVYVPSEVDGAMEEGTPMVPPGASRQYSFVAQPSGSRWYHTHATAYDNLSLGHEWAVRWGPLEVGDTDTNVRERQNRRGGRRHKGTLLPGG